MHPKYALTLVLSLFLQFGYAQDVAIPKLDLILEVDTNDIAKEPDVMPVYPGGELGLLEFISNEVNYPPICKENGITGVVYVAYVVDVDGAVKNVQVVRGADPFLNQESVRVVKSLKNYRAGTQNGVKVPVQFTIPIRFTLNNPSMSSNRIVAKREKSHPINAPLNYVLPQYDDGDTSLYRFINEKLKYPSIALENAIVDTVKLKYLVDRSGKVSKAIRLGKCDPLLYAECERVVKLIDGYAPGYKNGELASFEYAATFTFQLTYEKSKSSTTTVHTHARVVSIKEPTESDAIVIVEKMPKYPGGDMSLIQFIAETVRYPTIAKNNKTTGVVYVSYIVDIDGSVKDVKIAKGTDPFLDKEAVRVVQLIKGYQPGTQDGKPVPVQFTIPIRFVLTGNTNRSTNRINLVDRRVNPEAQKAYEDAQVAMKNSDFDEAIKQYTKSISIDPNNYVPFYGRAIAHYSKEQFQAAELDFMESISRSNHEHLNSYIYRAMMRYENGQVDHAQKDFEKALILDKKSYQALIGLAKCLSNQGNLKKARKTLSKALKKEPKNPEAPLYLGILAFTDRDFETALKLFTQVISLDGQNGSAYYYLGMCYAQKKDITNACEYLIKAKDLGYEDAKLIVQSQCQETEIE